MAHLTISEVAQRVGLRSSAIRYYEQIGLLPPAQRVGNQRRFDTVALYRLAVIQRARQLGFTLSEIRELFLGFGKVTRVSDRWRKLSQRKIDELNSLMVTIKEVLSLLEKMMNNCRCETLDQCGKAIFHGASGFIPAKPPGAKVRRA